MRVQKAAVRLLLCAMKSMVTYLGPKVDTAIRHAAIFLAVDDRLLLLKASCLARGMAHVPLRGSHHVHAGVAQNWSRHVVL